MFTENQLIPYKRSLLPPGNWLVLAPHPDDETLGMGGTLILGQQKNIKIHISWITNGEKGGLPKIRRQEARLAAKLLKIESFDFWGLPDRGVLKEIPQFFKNLKKVLTKRVKTIFIPNFLEFHPDHRAVSFLALSFLKKIKWSGEIWLYEISRQAEANRLIDITDVAKYKNEAILVYQSQIKENDYQNIALSINRARSYTLKDCKFAEAFFASTPHLLIEDFFTHYKYYFL